MEVEPFDCVYLDPPWMERGAGKIKRGADRHYSLMKTKEMPAIIKGSGVWSIADNAHCYLWATKTFLPDALWLMGELGFTYKTLVTWVKFKKDSAKNRKGFVKSFSDGDPIHVVAQTGTACGMGQYFRGGVEVLLFGVKGRGFAVRSEERAMRDHFFAPLGAHSEKPQEARQLIERRTVAPGRPTRRLEMFGRRQVEGWTVWGNEAHTEG